MYSANFSGIRNPMQVKDKELLSMLVTLFERETMFSSRPETDHPYFVAIVEWGKHRPNDVIPFLLSQVDRNWHWCWALWRIVDKEKAPHIPEEHAGQGHYISEAWTAWGQANGYS